MIIDKLSDLRRYIPSLPALETVCSILESGVLKDQSFGSYTTDNPSVRYNLFTYHTEKTESDIYEIHQRRLTSNSPFRLERMDIVKDGLETVQSMIRQKPVSKGRRL